MRIAVPDFVSSTLFPLIAAKEFGFFKDEGLDIEIVHTYALQAAEALRDGTVDFSAGPAHAPLIIFPKWSGVKLIATLSQGTPWLLVMRSGLGARRGDLDAVKGRRIAAAPGPDLVFKHLLREAAIDIEKDRVEIGAPPGTTEAGVSFGVASGRALAEGRVDGIWANVLGGEVAVHLGGGSVVIDPRRGDGPPGAGRYSFAAIATSESKIETEPERVEAVIRAVVKTQSVLRQDPLRATEVGKKLFPPVEAEVIGRLLARDAEFYEPSISEEAITELNRFAQAVGLLSSPVPYGQVVATQFRSLWSE
jgi:ABC-type nitrate/sulfonate/bicarbonate transport system substrate-binding protein